MSMKRFSIPTLAVALIAATGLGAPAAEFATGDIRRDGVVRAVEQVTPSVVNIATKTAERLAVTPVYDWYFGELLGRKLTRIPEQRSAGSGVIIDADGWVLTNVHVVENAVGDRDEIWVRLWDGSRELRAKAIFGIPGTDVALLKLQSKPGEKFTPVKLAADNDIILGETVLALGNPLGLGSSVSKGILSAKPRRADPTGTELDNADWIQTDAAINPGNSGGPLVNLKGELIGLNVAMARGGQGIGFAVPAKRVAAALAEFFSPEAMAQRWMGLRFLRAPDGGFTISDVHPGSPAAKAGVKTGDKIETIDGRAPENAIDAATKLSESKGAVSLKLLRAGKSVTTSFSSVPLDTVLTNKLGAELVPIDAAMSKQTGLAQGSGLMVTSVERGGPAEASGIRAGCLIQGFNNGKVKDTLGAAALLWSAKPGDVVKVNYTRFSRRGGLLLSQDSESDVEIR